MSATNTKNSFDQMKKTWVSSYLNLEKVDQNLGYPSETLIRLLKGDYVTGTHLEVKGKKILDVGFGCGNNLLLYTSLGMQVSGVEIDQGICDQFQEKIKDHTELKMDLSVGSNQQLPYEDNTFDFLVSWNALHYESTEQGIINAIKEFQRVLKPGGRLFVSTTGPKHKILLNGTTCGNHLYQIGRPGDDRVGQIHFFFDAPNYIELYFSPCFKELQIGRTEDVLFRETLDWWIVTGVK